MLFLSWVLFPQPCYPYTLHHPITQLPLLKVSHVNILVFVLIFSSVLYIPSYKHIQHAQAYIHICILKLYTCFFYKSGILLHKFSFFRNSSKALLGPCCVSRALWFSVSCFSHLTVSHKNIFTSFFWWLYNSYSS